jgi:hypothetical protein
VLAAVNDKPAVALRAIIDRRCAAGSPFSLPRPCACGAAGLGGMERAIARASLLIAEVCRLGMLGRRKIAPRHARNRSRDRLRVAAVPLWALLTRASLSARAIGMRSRAMRRTMLRRKLPPLFEDRHGADPQLASSHQRRAPHPCETHECGGSISPMADCLQPRACSSARVAGLRCSSAPVAIGATSTAIEDAPRCGGASSNARPAGTTKVRVMVAATTPHAPWPTAPGKRK